MRRIKVTPVENIPLREGRQVRLGSTEIAIFNLGERFVAIENRCPHSGGPLSEGIVSNFDGATTVTCPLHNWRICVDSGNVAKPSGETACVRSYQTSVEDGIVVIAMEEECSAA
jgi:nitrite reductase (NADH) small subunit